MIFLHISGGGIGSLFMGLLFFVVGVVFYQVDVQLSIGVHVSIVVGRLDSLGQVLFDDVVYCGFADSYFLGYVSV